MNFTNQDLEQIQANDLNVDIIENQIQLFKTGIPFTQIVQAATIGNGILALDQIGIDKYLNTFETRKEDFELVKFVPASGAATRMFKFLFQFLEDFNPNEQSIEDFTSKSENHQIEIFKNNMERLPFFKLVLDELKTHGSFFETLSDSHKIWQFVEVMLAQDRLNYGICPKGLLPFHKYSDQHVATAFEEHLYEAALYASNNDKAKLHFTISEDFRPTFEKEFERILESVVHKTGVSYHVTYSYQHSSTDTIAVNLDNSPFRTESDTLLFRPSGHGALLQNLNEVNADIIFIKNIDNVVVEKYREDVARYKKVLAGILIELQSKAFSYLELIDKNENLEDQLNDITTFLSEHLNTRIPDGFENLPLSEKRGILHKLLNRPIRVCGMVKNEGEPGGGPFWIEDEHGNQSLQIVESAQIDLNNEHQKNIFDEATHFNPVDLVCGVKDYKGQPFDLHRFVNNKAAFITNKTQAGKNLKALELPGLWNGSMAHWNTIFVEVPIITFNPVKTVNDLLKPAHQI